jgi:excisionase family DNA binding protein
MNEVASNNEKPSGTVRVPQAAVMLSVSTRTIWRMIAEGQLKPVRFRRCTRLLLADVTKYLNNN